MNSIHDRIIRALKRSNPDFERELDIRRYYPLDKNCSRLESMMYYDNTINRIIICYNSWDKSYDVEAEIFDPSIKR